MKEKALNIIRDELQKRGIEIVKVFLFGSRARGDFRADSDWDFYIIVDREMSRQEKWDTILNIKRRLAKLKIPNDIIINSYNEMEKKQNDVGYLAYYVMKEGIEL